MKTWAALFKKDFRLTRTVFFVGLAMNVLVVMLTMYLGTIAEDTLLTFVPLAVAVGLHVLYIPIMVWLSLRTEANQLQIWLHTPKPASALLVSKLVNGLMMISISLAMLYGMSRLAIIPKFDLIEAYWTDTWMMGVLAFPHIIMLSLLLGVWMIFLWALYQFLKFKIGRLSWLAVIGAVIFPSLAFAYFESTSLYRALTEWGGTTYHFPTFSIDPIQTYAGEYIYNLILIIGLFLLTAWVLDNKVEV